MKKTLFGSILAFAVLAFTSAFGADTHYVRVITPTNAVPALTTHSTEVGLPINIGDDTQIGLLCQIYERTNSAGTGLTALMTFARSMDGVTYETTPRLTWGFTSSGTNTALGVAATNMTVGHFRFLKLVSILNSCSNAIYVGPIYAGQINR